MNTTVIKDAGDADVDVILQVLEHAKPVNLKTVNATGKADEPVGHASPILAPSILSEADFDKLEIAKRESLLGDWFKEGDLGFIFGKRGLGKSWLALSMARALAEAGQCGPWSASRACRVLYVDGEMSADDLRSRNVALREHSGELLFLSHQVVFDRTQNALCLSDPAQQAELTALCERKNIKVVVLDNVACLFRGIEENSADDWRDNIENWLLDLRRRGISVVIVAHAGRNTTTMRGTSKREDAAFWVIRLDEVSDSDSQTGARFVTRFVKQRNAPNDPPPLDWQFKPDGGRVTVTYRDADNLVIFRQWIVDGLETCGDIAEEMGMSKGNVSKLAKRAEKEGWLKKYDRKYQIIEP